MIKTNTSQNSLYTNPFLLNLAKSLHVKNIPLTIFLFILIWISCFLIIIFIILCIRGCLRKRYALKRHRRQIPPTYIDEIPGLDRDLKKHKFGNLQYNLNYIVENNELKVGVVSAEGLPKPLEPTTLDTYVTVSLLKIDSKEDPKPVGKIECTHVIFQNERPCWRKIFSYKIPENELKNIVIIFELFNYHNVQQNTSIGKLKLQLDDLDESKYAGQVFENFGWLEQGNELSYGLGEMCIGLAQYPEFNRLDICIYECRNLNLNHRINLKKIRGLEVLVQVKYKKKTIKSEKTCTRKEMINPYYWTKISFKIEQEDWMTELMILCKLRYIDQFYFRHVLGICVIGPNSLDSTGIKHWDRMIKGPAKMHVLWHIID